MNEQSVREAMQRAIDMFESETALAVACGVTQTAINKAKRTQRVSVDLAMNIHRVTGGRVTGAELRPDLWRDAADVPIERMNGRPRR